MKSIGGLLVLLGIGSIILPMINLQFTLISWIDNWGPTVGWVIRGVMIVAGAAMFFLGSNEGDGDAAA